MFIKYAKINRKTNKKFSDLVQKLKGDPVLEGKDVSAYLIDPILRLSRYKLLVDAVIKLLPSDEESEVLDQGINLSKVIDRVSIL